MTESAERIEKVESQLQSLVELYSQIFPVLRGIDRAKYDAKSLMALDSALDPPLGIQPAKAAAVLKAIMGSTNEDRIQLETFYSVPLDAETSVGRFVDRRVVELGLGYHDFWPFLRAHGWVNESA